MPQAISISPHLVNEKREEALSNLPKIPQVLPEYFHAPTTLTGGVSSSRDQGLRDMGNLPGVDVGIPT